MSSIFSGLESMGLKNLGDIKIYEEPEKEEKKKQVEVHKEPVVTESDFLFEKRIQCPVCDKEFHNKTVKTGKPRLIGSDSDLRPKYVGIDSVKYDAIVCPNCGYAALSRFFSYMTSAQSKLIIENVSKTFKGLPASGDVYTYEEAINRYKLALYNTVVKRGKNSEKAYTCLKIAWLFRGMKENIDDSNPKAPALRIACDASEKEMLFNAFDGFLAGRSKEDFPICGMDEPTLDYLLADIATRLGKYDIASKFASDIIVSRIANAKLKERARDLRDSIKDKVKA